MPLQELEDAARVLERRVLLRRLAVLEPPPWRRGQGLAAERGFVVLDGAADAHARVLPGRVVVAALLFVPAREEAVEVLGVFELLVDDHRRVGVVDDVVAELAPVLEDVVDDPAQERDVAAGPDRHVQVASALVRVKRGSTWTIFAPRSFASITH